MLFNSPEFIFFFLPITLILFFILGKINNKLAIFLLLIASLFFYSWGKLEYLLLISSSVLFNYFWGILLEREILTHQKKLYLGIGILVNLGLLGYFKYSNFFLESTNHLFNISPAFQKIALPLGISFFTFQQIGYLADTCYGKVKVHNFLHYGLFVCFFPQLVAGPIVNSQDILPQFNEEYTYKFNIEDLAIGMSIFTFGLFKKIVIADSLSVYVAPLFNNATWGINPTLFEAWGGALAYTFQLYFDFSGYSDMAIGLARMFRIKLPQNFNSPYKAFCIIDFWRRWHISLSNFLRDYLYIPLGGNRNGTMRRDFNLMTTMLLGGLWHGAGWTFVFWGGLHGIYLVVNNYWHSFLKNLGHNPDSPKGFIKVVGVAITFTLVVVSWVIFRADSISAAGAILRGMAGLNGMMIPETIANSLWSIRYMFTTIGANFTYYSAQAEYNFIMPFIWTILLLPVIWFLPNTQEWMSSFEIKSEQTQINKEPQPEPENLISTIPYKPIWQLNIGYGILIGCILFITLKFSFALPQTNFLYFNF
ncbi:MAG: MBOAT family O-acyltransferase [Nostoc sp.]|uniref:MBOAT family O-acyltransferase n=1 Tax=Nostoc sp. TaxID=1180 RepID=UPI002FEF0F00